METETQEIQLPVHLSVELQAIYSEMEKGYDRVAHEIGLSCVGCPDNCCDSYFLHHTYSEWAYLWQGVRNLPGSRQNQLLERSRQYVRQSREVMARGERPQIACPLLDDQGRCSLYSHRLLVCRMHGVPATMTRPDGRSLRFPGCFRCQEIVEKRYRKSDVPSMDRTPLFRRMAALERALLGDRPHLYPRVRLTIAEMIVQGPPQVRLPHCQRSSKA